MSYIYIYICLIESLLYEISLYKNDSILHIHIQDVLVGIVNTLGAGSMDYSK